MTFSYNADVTSKEEIDSALILAYTDMLKYYAENLGASRLDVEAANMAADARKAAHILSEFAWAAGASKVRISILGHANPNNERTPGWSNPMLSISVSITEWQGEYLTPGELDWIPEPSVYAD